MFGQSWIANQYRVQLQSSTTLQPVTTQGKIELILIGANNFNETFTLTKYEKHVNWSSRMNLIQILVLEGALITS